MGGTSMYNEKTRKFTKLKSKIQNQFDKIQSNKDLSLQDKRDKSSQLFLENGIFGGDVYDLKNRSHMTSWYNRRMRVLAHYGDIQSKQHQETARRRYRKNNKVYLEKKRKEKEGSLEGNIIKAVFGRKWK